MGARTIISSVITPPVAMFTGGGVYDLIDLQTVKGILGITGPDQDTYLKLLIAQVSGGIRKHCGRTFQAQTVQDQIWSQRDPNPALVAGGNMPLNLSRWPIIGPASNAGTGAPLFPVLSKIAGGALAAANYFVRITYVTPMGETPVSLEASLIVAANNLLKISSPALDLLALATGWNVYVGANSGSETLQNATPIAIGTAWTEPTSGLIAGTAMPSFVSVIENLSTSIAVGGTNVPINLIEGTDFLSDFDKGELTRLSSGGYPRKWPAFPFVVIYQSGFAVLPPEIQDACIRLVRGAYFSLTRDPMLRQENISGVYEATYWFGNGPGASAGYPPDVQDLLDHHRVPVIA